MGYYVVHDSTEIVAKFDTLGKALAYLGGIKIDPQEYQICKIIFNAN